MEKVKSCGFFKIESPYGTDSTPLAATDAIEIYGEPNFELTADEKEKNIGAVSFGQMAPLVIGKAYKVSGLKIPFKGSGAAGTAPRIGCILRALGFTQTINTGVSVVYESHNDFDTESLTCYLWKGGTKHILKGCVGNGKLNLKSGEEIFIEPEFTAVYGGTIADATFPTPTFETTPNIVWQNANFVATVQPSTTVALIIDKFDIDLGNEVNARPDPNGAYGINRYYGSDRKTKVSLDPEKEDLTTFNPYTLFENQTLMNFETKPTGAAGNKIEISIIDVSLGNPKIASRNNVNTWDLNGQVRLKSADDDDVKITITFK